MSEVRPTEPPIGSLSLEFVEGLLADYARNPDSVAPDWRRYFDELMHGQNGGTAKLKENGDGHAPDMAETATVQWLRSNS